MQSLSCSLSGCVGETSLIQPYSNQWRLKGKKRLGSVARVNPSLKFHNSVLRPLEAVPMNRPLEAQTPSTQRPIEMVPDDSSVLTSEALSLMVPNQYSVPMDKTFWNSDTQFASGDAVYFTTSQCQNKQTHTHTIHIYVGYMYIVYMYSVHL